MTPLSTSVDSACMSFFCQETNTEELSTHRLCFTLVRASVTVEKQLVDLVDVCGSIRAVMTTAVAVLCPTGRIALPRSVLSNVGRSESADTRWGHDRMPNLRAKRVI